MLIPVSSCPPVIKDESLVYRGEGNSNLVVALRQERKVIRLFKADAKQLKDRKPSLDQILVILEAHIRFNEKVVPQLIPDHFYATPQLIRLTETQIKAINRLVECERPSYRLEKGVSEADTFALLLPDYCALPKSLRHFRTSGPVIGVEIKPKQGFLPENALLSEELRVKSRVCRYCLSQFHKVKKGSVGERSQYCPLDLFSGCADRQMTSLLALIANPQNNFRVFRDQRLAFSSDRNSTLLSAIKDLFADNRQKNESIERRFARLLIQALQLSANEDIEEGEDSQEGKEEYCLLHSTRDQSCACMSSKGHALKKGSVLERVLHAQRLDSIDCERANQFLELLEENNNEWTLQSIPEHFTRRERQEEESDHEFHARKVWQFLVSLTAKDCSIMIAMQRLVEQSLNSPPTPHVIVDHVTRDQYLVSVSVTDLDPKFAPKIKRTLSNDKRMAKAFRLSAGAQHTPSLL